MRLSAPNLLLWLWLSFLYCGAAAPTNLWKSPFGVTDKISGKHVSQKEADNCWIVAGIKMVATMDPNQLLSMMELEKTAEGDPPAVKVTLVDPETYDTGCKTVTQTISWLDVHDNYGLPSIVRPGTVPPQGPWWPAALALAIQKVTGVKCEEPEHVNKALEYIYGRTVPLLRRGEKPLAEWEEELHKAFSTMKYKVTLVSTRDEKYWPSDSDLQQALKDYDLYDLHAYGVSEYHANSRTVALHNPHDDVVTPIELSLSKAAKILGFYAQTPASNFKKLRSHNPRDEEASDPTQCGIEPVTSTASGTSSSGSGSVSSSAPANTSAAETSATAAVASSASVSSSGSVAWSSSLFWGNWVSLSVPVPTSSGVSTSSGTLTQTSSAGTVTAPSATTTSKT